MIEIYGIKNCDTIKKTLVWLTDHGIDYQFHDYKQAGTPPQLREWCNTLGWDTLLNTRGTTWRKLTEQERSDIDADKALALMQTHPSLIRRPVIRHPHGLIVGFDIERLNALKDTR